MVHTKSKLAVMQLYLKSLRMAIPVIAGLINHLLQSLDCVLVIIKCFMWTSTFGIATPRKLDEANKTAHSVNSCHALHMLVLPTALPLTASYRQPYKWPRKERNSVNRAPAVTPSDRWFTRDIHDDDDMEDPVPRTGDVIVLAPSPEPWSDEVSITHKPFFFSGRNSGRQRNTGDRAKAAIEAADFPPFRYPQPYARSNSEGMALRLMSEQHQQQPEQMETMPSMDDSAFRTRRLLTASMTMVADQVEKVPKKRYVHMMNCEWVSK